MERNFIALSDMYLPTAFVRELLENAGLDGIEVLYVSSDTRLTKGSGRLFSHVLAQLGIAPQDMLHIGDNYQADVVIPRKLGIGAFHYPAPQVQILQSGHVNPAVIRSLVKSGELEASLLAGLFVQANLRPQSEHTDYWHNTGYHIAGPLAYAFTSWVAQRARELDLNGLFFLSRDGSLPWKIYEKYFAEIPAKYIFASQRMFFVPSIEALDDDTMRFLTSGEINAPAREYFERLDIGVPDGLDADLTEQFGDPHRAIGSRDRIKRLGAIFGQHDNWLKQAAETERRTILGYLNSVGFTDAKRKAIVDIGWLGSTQKYLEKLRVDSESLFGLYLGLSERGYKNGRNEGFAFTYGTPSKRFTSVFKCAEFYELIF